MGVVCLSLFAVIGARAQDGSQDLAEAARQQRARKAALAESARAETHVYTNDDLQRSHILLEEDSARVAAHKQNPAPEQAAAMQASTPVSQNAKALAVGDVPSGASESLGAVARRYRQEKMARAENQAGGIPNASRFKLEIAPNALAELAPSVAPRVAHSVLPLAAPLAATTLRSGSATKTVTGGILRRRDPFSRPPTGLTLERVGAANPLPASPTPALPIVPKAIVPPSRATNPAQASGPIRTFASVLAGGPWRGKLVAPAPSPLAGSTAETVTIRAGDSLWKLSRRYSGSGVRWREWLARNPGLNDPRSLRVGTILVLPKSEYGSPPRAAPVTQAETQKTIVVRNGGSLWKIVAERYGDGTRWSCLALGNPALRDARSIYPGEVLMLPAVCGNAPSSRGTPRSMK